MVSLLDILAVPSALAAGPRVVTAPAWEPVWPARRPAGSGTCPAWVPVWAGLEAGRLWQVTGLEPARPGGGRPVLFFFLEINN